jgi:hypothetical protein
LDANVIKVLFLYGSAGLDLDQTPSSVPATMKHIDKHYNPVVLECGFEDCRDFTVGDQLPRGAHRLIEPALAADLDSTGKQLAGEHPHLVSLLHNRFGCSVGLRCEFGLI